MFVDDDQDLERAADARRDQPVFFLVLLVEAEADPEAGDAIDLGRDPRDQGANSDVLLLAAATIIAQRQKLTPHAAAMVANVPVDLGISPDSVNIKDKTNEKLGYLGRKKAIEARAVSSNVHSDSGQQPGARPEQIRVFFALWPQPEVARYLADVADSIATRAGGRAIRQEAIHLTLAFIGDVAIERLPDLERAAREVRCEAFALTLDRFGVWRHNRIFHAGCSVPPAALAALSAALTAALSTAGFAVADARRTFIPHVTLVRKLVALDAELPECEPVAWSSRQFVLVRSTPSAHGSSYRTIAEFPLLAGSR